MVRLLKQGESVRTRLTIDTVSLNQTNMRTTNVHLRCCAGERGSNQKISDDRTYTFKITLILYLRMRLAAIMKTDGGQQMKLGGNMR